MPYYLYKIFETPIRRLEKIESHDSFKAASARAKVLRRELALAEGCGVRTIFAENELQAEDLLSQAHETQPEPGDGDY
ncbi:MAG: hypothetical protein LC123_06265 [Burkholderiales bacterium]|jgi:hypothetical protein|uniref:Uncharacterized protein n=1 Tax=Candidatus Desulfobacillus denitrificans TaxID=2608985 RepID=A0A809RK70_9PROT|nr:hypothetical protein [Zoogloeaceae bacterium]MBP9653276.1 hypothetical protein [Rhodocyclaceae bacterium]MCZ2173594.1 hypothetical protein [Burkholderiales bacterium]OQY72836.1 MAG: hypothetical protein B6D47_04410 [Rhodocyclaceae bacterium UTPRO2]BBO19842.1 conserved hypothetical protein [Candidatus Desulfobacillus denitrificans]GIK46763.1 MAG: hypothetical protein BroJett012_26660 [Betaproteobacteria bacterium]